ncbi:MAG TPA: hypothetical protein DEO65_08780 [Bacillus bacterium]|nr:hypothetical protein [Bacillus sp. (in: firmicutes)]
MDSTRGAKLYATVDYEEWENPHREERTTHPYPLNDFGKGVLKAEAEGDIVMTLDNSRVHRVKAIVTFLEHPRLSIVSPQACGKGKKTWLTMSFSANFITFINMSLFYGQV